MRTSHGTQDSIAMGPSCTLSQKSLPDSLISDFCASTVGHLIRPSVPLAL